MSLVSVINTILFWQKQQPTDIPSEIHLFLPWERVVVRYVNKMAEWHRAPWNFFSYKFWDFIDSLEQSIWRTFTRPIWLFSASNNTDIWATLGSHCVYITEQKWPSTRAWPCAMLCMYVNQKGLCRVLNVVMERIEDLSGVVGRTGVVGRRWEWNKNGKLCVVMAGNHALHSPHHTVLSHYVHIHHRTLSPFLIPLLSRSCPHFSPWALSIPFPSTNII